MNLFKIFHEKTNHTFNDIIISSKHFFSSGYEHVVRYKFSCAELNEE